LKREYLEDKKKINFKFEQNKDDFIVDEIPKKFKRNGNFLILHVKKVELTTWDMVAAFAAFLNIPAEKIGYAGLKATHATTTQYLSFESKSEKQLKKFRHRRVKVLDTTRDTLSLRVGDREANGYGINLSGVT